MELDTVIYPKDVISNIILRYVRSIKNKSSGSNMQTLYSIVQGRVEAYEFLVNGDSAVVGKPLSELDLKKNIIIAAIMRGRSVITPRGHDSIMPGDSVIVVAEDGGLLDISDILDR